MDVTELITLVLNVLFSKIKKYFQNLSSITSYAHQQSLCFIVGTINDPQWIELLVKQSVNGIVPDNPKIFSLAGITKRNIELYKEHGKYYVPRSMQKRLHIQ